jgi:hypothetical protein
MSDHNPQIVKASDEHAAEARLPSAATATPHRAADREGLPHSHKFLAATLGLVAVAVAALAAATVIASGGRGATRTGSTWSSWSPTNTGLPGAQEIADYVAPYYRATPAQQLAVVTAVNLNSASNPLQIAIPSSSASGTSGSLVPLPSSNTVVYNLCGVGSKDCSIGVGQPSPNRLLLLRREGLELALYTFKYISGTNTVVAILPPGRTVQGCTGICAKPREKTTTKSLDVALAFDRAELSPWLSRPLRKTLPEQLPPTVSQITSSPEAELVSILTAHGLFSEHAAQAQDGSTVLALSPMPPQ